MSNSSIKECIPSYASAISTLLFIVSWIFYKYLDLDVLTAIFLIFLGFFIISCAYYKELNPLKWRWYFKSKCQCEPKSYYKNLCKCELNSKDIHKSLKSNPKLFLGIGASILISGLFEMSTLQILNEGSLIIVRILLVITITFISLFTADAINKS